MSFWQSHGTIADFSKSIDFSFLFTFMGRGGEGGGLGKSGVFGCFEPSVKEQTSNKENQEPQ